jgi:hypothetical protein
MKIIEDIGFLCMDLNPECVFEMATMPKANFDRLHANIYIYCIFLNLKYGVYECGASAKEKSSNVYKPTLM